MKHKHREDPRIEATQEDIAEVLGWSIEDVRSFSLRSLRDLVRPVNPGLAKRIIEDVGYLQRVNGVEVPYGTA